VSRAARRGAAAHRPTAYFLAAFFNPLDLGSGPLVWIRAALSPVRARVSRIYLLRLIEFLPAEQALL
jgi:hypothetical protein